MPQVAVGILKYKVDGVSLAYSLATNAILLHPSVIWADGIFGFVFCHISPSLSIRVGVAPSVPLWVLKISCISDSSLSPLIAVDDILLPYSLVFLVKVFPIGFVHLAGTVASYGSPCASLTPVHCHLPSMLYRTTDNMARVSHTHPCTNVRKFRKYECIARSLPPTLGWL